MWVYDKVSRAYVGQAGSEIASDCEVTAIAPPDILLGEIALFGDDSQWHIRQIQPVTRAQGRLALHRAGLLPQIEAVIAQADIEARIWYEDAQAWERDSAYVIQLGAALDLSESQIDALFLGEA